jgi:hypothetical protein
VAGQIYTANAKGVIASRQGDQVGFQWDQSTDTRIGTNESEVEMSDKRFKPTIQSAGLDALNAAIGLLGKT